ncbi:MAG: hypothetical protein J6568_06655, partial [Snodgrassella sp.]|nr:hypothetical protein [Snodgrassella sp.]
MFIVHKNRHQSIFKFIFISAISLYYHSYSFAVNHFADTPLHLHNQSIQTTGYGHAAKPNITFFIDDSGSMTEPADPKARYLCYYRTSECKLFGPETYPGYWSCLRWSWSPWSANKVERKPQPPVTPSNPKKMEYSYCGYEGPTRIEAVINVLEQLVKKYRNDFYYSLQLLNTHTEYVWKPNPQTGRWDYVREDHPEYNQFYDTEQPQDYKFIINHISGLRALGGTPTFARINAVARNTLMNKLKYRCQKSYLIILSDGEAHSDAPVTDSTRFQTHNDFGYDGYFDGDTFRDDTM